MMALGRIGPNRHPSPRVNAEVAPMDEYEFQMFYDCGLMPERFWPAEIETLKARYLADEISLAELERELAGLLDIRGLAAA